MIAGYLLSLCLGMVDLSGVGGSAWFALPEFMPFEIKFVPAACVSLGIVYVVNAVQTIGDLSSTTMGGMDRMPTDRELSGGIIGQGIMSILGAFFGGLPAATYSQNVGIVTVNRVINRAVFALAAVILLVAGLMPKFASLLTTHPPVRHRRRHHLRVRHHHHDRIRMITEGGLHPPARARWWAWPWAPGRGHHSGGRLPVRRGLPPRGSTPCLAPLPWWSPPWQPSCST